mmetsp:Transcript_6546/g.11529  ORF Transcript_6546/g.11529 Transcript_6546/m.11529 type:complete len:275 (-) Transcript_6546:5825-6649(-)
MFKFDFFKDGDNAAQDREAERSRDGNEVQPAKKLELHRGDLEAGDRMLRIEVGHNVSIDIVQTMNTKLEDEGMQDVVEKTDVQKGVYEGGFKLWECSIDVARYLESEGSSFMHSSKLVLDLGCGHGLPGVYVAKKGCTVWFQDLNEEVLKRQTMKNVAQNGCTVSEHCFVSGDWSSFLDVVDDKRFDLIITAETIYSVDTFATLHDIFSGCLSSHGVILVAAKRYYFGVGGGTTAFSEYVNSRGAFSAETVSSYEDGSSNVRDIVLLKRVPIAV